ncbi:MAG: RNA-directed DNA polymerase [Planctomycetes bacterium]|nr:RNA-directed DNA polymerase [Planctomycetota bacterium]
MRDQTLGGARNPQTGAPSVAGAISGVGGTPGHPDPYFDAGRVASHELPALTHLDALAELIETPRNELLWLAVKPPFSNKLWGHYHLFEVRKKSGGTRLLAAPMPRLKAVQRKLLDKLVSRLPVHGAAHGFRRGRGILSGANVHVGKDVLVCLDIKDFFPSFTFRRVSGYFRWLGYGRGIANAIAALTTARLTETNQRQGTTWAAAHTGMHPDMNHRRHPELPQGAPTSPGLANAICWRMDKRLSALARKFGGDYTRYADDLTFSGGQDMARHTDNLIKLVRKIVRSEGLQLNDPKTRVMQKGRQQRVTGVVVNEKTNLSRREFDRLKAILHNCVKHGPAGQNRENHTDFKGHLQGRVAHAMHIGPERGAKLKAIFDKIVW